MKNLTSFENFISEKKKNKENKDLKKACWSGYEAIGLKKKNGKMVPNCVPVNK